MTPRLAIAAAALLMAAAVALGAFGAHALKARLAPDMLAVWQTGVMYHAWHGMALLLLGVLMLHAPDSAALRYAAWLFIAGVAAPSPIGVATPIGGLAFIAGWITLAIGALRARIG
jgi:uncharacterized membrane protein YgdD (TMEM256/DUF423 family)